MLLGYAARWWSPVRHTRLLRLVLDLADVEHVDPINLGTLVAACYVGGDHQVAVFLDHSSASLPDC